MGALCALCLVAVQVMSALAAPPFEVGHPWRLTAIIVNETDPDLDPDLWIASAEVSPPKDNSALLQLYFGPGGWLHKPVTLLGAEVIVEYCDALGRVLARGSAKVKAPETDEDPVAASPIRLKGIPTDTDYIFVWLKWMNISGELIEFNWPADPHQLGVAVLRERLRLADYLGYEPNDDVQALIDRLVMEIADAFRE
ncbi:MAG: hypothetical protein ACOX38_06975 [Bacillota bacterium]